MSRSGYIDDVDNEWEWICWRGAVASAIRGKRGQAFLRELLAALDALPDKRLIAEELQNADGEVCALGALGQARQLDMSNLDPEEAEAIAAAFGIAPALAREVVFQNDEQWSTHTPEQRWQSMRNWVASLITASPTK